MLGDKHGGRGVNDAGKLLHEIWTLRDHLTRQGWLADSLAAVPVQERAAMKLQANLCIADLSTLVQRLEEADAHRT
jgi:hypothetical protein